MRSFCALLFTFVLFSTSFAQQKAPTESAMDRFLRYVKIDTQSAEEAGKFPSTEKQLVLARLLETELKALGVQNVRISPEGIVYGMVPGISLTTARFLRSVSSRTWIPLRPFRAPTSTRSFTKTIRAATSSCRMIRRRSLPSHRIRI